MADNNNNEQLYDEISLNSVSRSYPDGQGGFTHDFTANRFLDDSHTAAEIYRESISLIPELLDVELYKADESEEIIEGSVYTAAEAIAYNAALEGAVKAGDSKGETESESEAYEYIHDEASWNASYANGGLKKYYAAYPDEDLWNAEAGRAANFNDRVYTVEVYQGSEKIGDAELQATWGEAAQKVTDRSTHDEYYMTMSAVAGEDLYELFEDADLATSTGKSVKILSIGFPDCTHTWIGASSAPGAKYPWIVLNFTDDVQAKVRFRYPNYTDIAPWGDVVFGTSKDWGCASVPTEFANDGFLLVDGESSFDISKFKLILVKEEFYT